jgi:hypothetical protein
VSRVLQRLSQERPASHPRGSRAGCLGFFELASLAAEASVPPSFWPKEPPVASGFASPRLAGKVTPPLGVAERWAMACWRPALAHLFGWGVILRYGLTALNPFGNLARACSSESDGTTITSSPSCQLTGVATLC